MRIRFPANRYRRITIAQDDINDEFQLVKQDMARDAEVLKGLHPVIMQDMGYVVKQWGEAI